ncbi:PHB depolymerase family esterase [Xanthobacter sp. DSM 24535]|uniref:alpha/beta hydrolase family esterase n=1 Tax=Roseixanthobacter psychrophilus TaxID=3119917 RepID=UPI00372B8737
MVKKRDPAAGAAGKTGSAGGLPELARRFAYLPARAALVLALSCGPLAAQTVTQNAVAPKNVVQEHTLQVGDEKRTYLLSRPQGVAGPRPTIIALHGAAQTSQSFMGYFGLEPTAVREGLVVAYPQGIGRVWDDSRPAAMRLKAALRPGEDAPYLLMLAQSLVAEGIADPSRIYLVGISNGGFMVERMACEHAEVFAAYAVIMATAPANTRETCRPARAVPIMFIHGTADPVIGWDGFWTPLGATLSAPDSAQLYAKANGCGAAQVTQLPDVAPLDGTRVSVRRWEGCRDNAEVALFRVDRGGHQPPAQVETTGELAQPFLGLRSQDIDSGQEIWAFFSRFALPSPAGAVVPLGAVVSPSSPGGRALAGVPLPQPSPVKSSQGVRPAVRQQ